MWMTTINKGDKAFGYTKCRRDNLKLPSRCKRRPGFLLPLVQHPWDYQKYPLHHATLQNRFFCRKKLAETFLQLQPYKNAYRCSRRAIRQIERVWRGLTLRPIPGPCQTGDWIEAHWLKARASEGRGRPDIAFDTVKRLVPLNSDPGLDAEMKGLKGKESQAKVRLNLS